MTEAVYFHGEWGLVPTDGNGPSPRCGHTLSIHGSDSDSTYDHLLVTFGESSLMSDRDYHSDIFTLDLRTRTWRTVLPEHSSSRSVTFAPAPRADHAVASFGHNSSRALLFGGKFRDTYLDDLIIIKDIASREVRIEPVHFPAGPCGRRGCSLTAWKDNSFLLFGGQRGGMFLNDIWGLDLKKGWVELSTKHNPSPRAFHSAFVDDQNKILVLGGVRDTQANPVSPDIYKLDLRVGKFFKMGDKDIVPGLGDALSKGHHTSHFIGGDSDLIVYAPQSASSYVLGGNTKSPHCGKCTEIVCDVDMSLAAAVANDGGGSDAMSATTSATEDDGHSSPLIRPKMYSPLTSCRPATCLMPSNKVPPELRNEIPQGEHQLYVLGGFVPSDNRCARNLRTLRFSSTIRRERNGIRPHDGNAGSATILSRSGSSSGTTPITRKKDHTKPSKKKTHPGMKRPRPEPSTTSVLDSILGTNLHEEALGLPRKKTKQLVGVEMDDDLGYGSPTATTTTTTIPTTLPSHLQPTPMRHTTVSRTNHNNTPTHMFNSTPRKLRVTLSKTPVRSHSSPRLLLKAIETEASQRRISKIDPALHSRDEDYLHSNRRRISSGNDLGPAGGGGSPPTSSTSPTSSSIFADTEDSAIRQLAWNVINSIIISPHANMLDNDNPFLLNPSELLTLIEYAQSAFEAEDVLLHVEAPVKVFGDIHGQLGDLMALFKAFGQPDHLIGDVGMYRYIFLGDFVDRGRKSLEVIALLLSLKIFYPDRVYLVRGNHECQAMNELYGFHEEIQVRMPIGSALTIQNAFNNLFKWLPLAAFIGERILCLHGGIGKISRISEISEIKRPCSVSCDAASVHTTQEGRVVDILWSDPAENDSELGFTENRRGVSCVFGSNVVREFCSKNDIDLIIRAHQVVKDGYEYFAGGHLITVFSATNYCGMMDNAGAMLCIDSNLRVTPKLVESSNHLNSTPSGFRRTPPPEQAATSSPTRPTSESTWQSGPPPSPMRSVNVEVISNKFAQVDLESDAHNRMRFSLDNFR